MRPNLSTEIKVAMLVSIRQFRKHSCYSIRNAYPPNKRKAETEATLSEDEYTSRTQAATSSSTSSPVSRHFILL